MINCNRNLFFSAILILWIMGGCDAVSDNRSSNSDTIEWLIPKNEIIDTGRNGIPSIYEPDFASVKEVDNFLDDDRFVIGIRFGDEIRAYPHQIIDHHEVVNDKINGELVSITYCPLSGTGIGWKGEVRGVSTEFGVAALFRNNLVLYDRDTSSYWSQMYMKSVAGERMGTNIETFPIVETTWDTWKSMYPESKVLNTNTGFSRNYSSFAYGKGYLNEDSTTLFPIKHVDNRLKNKVRVHGIVDALSATESSRVQVFPIRDFGSDIYMIDNDIIQSDVIVVGSSDKNFAVSFSRVMPDETRLQFEIVHNELPVIMKDQEGNKWDIFGFALEGPRKGEQLEVTRSFSGYWFAWADFFPNNLEIHDIYTSASN